ncbi:MULTISPECIES: hypothetical protein [unclassified Streptomyces]|uniref:hypothetical protein n=1 Tax=unclassified Streptomyces TaxID=2593676 RepID=UPI00386B2F29
MTGVGRSVGIGAGVARRLAHRLNVAFTYWTPYDSRMVWAAPTGVQVSEGQR